MYWITLNVLGMIARLHNEPRDFAEPEDIPVARNFLVDTIYAAGLHHILTLRPATTLAKKSDVFLLTIHASARNNPWQKFWCVPADYTLRPETTPGKKSLSLSLCYTNGWCCSLGLSWYCSCQERWCWCCSCQPRWCCSGETPANQQTEYQEDRSTPS